MIFTNEFGSSTSDYSRTIRINSTDSMPPGQHFNSSSALVEFNLVATSCIAPTVSTLAWRRLTHSEILSYVVAILDEDQSTAHISIELDDFNVVVRNLLDPSDQFRVQVANSNDSILRLNEITLRYLKPNTNYSFSLELDLFYWDNSVDSSSSSSVAKKSFKLVSESIECKTPSIGDAFGIDFLEIIGLGLDIFTLKTDLFLNFS